jgi:hypothetical protein
VIILQWDRIHNDPYFIAFITHLMLSLCVYALNTLLLLLRVYSFHYVFNAFTMWLCEWG